MPGREPSIPAAPTVAGLADVIDALRRELAVAKDRGRESGLRFRIGEVEVEFLVEVTADAEAETGIMFWVVSAGARGSLSRGTTHRVTLMLHPYDADTGEDAEVASRDQRPH